MATRDSNIKVCEKHGLTFDPALTSGCVICRREAHGEGEAPSPPDEDTIGLGKVVLYGSAAFLLVFLIYLGWAYSGERSSPLPLQSLFGEAERKPTAPPQREVFLTLCHFVVFNPSTGIDQERQYCSHLSYEQALDECNEKVIPATPGTPRGGCVCTADPRKMLLSCPNGHRTGTPSRAPEEDQ